MKAVRTYQIMGGYTANHHNAEGQVRCRQVCREPKDCTGRQPLSPSYIKAIIQYSFVHENVLKY